MLRGELILDIDKPLRSSHMNAIDRPNIHRLLSTSRQSLKADNDKLVRNMESLISSKLSESHPTLKAGKTKIYHGELFQRQVTR